MIQTTITTRQKIVTLAGITLFGIVTSLCIGRKVIPQTILTFLVFYFLSGERPSLVYASMRTIDRDFK